MQVFKIFPIFLVAFSPTVLAISSGRGGKPGKGQIKKDTNVSRNDRSANFRSVIGARLNIENGHLEPVCDLSDKLSRIKAVVQEQQQQQAVRSGSRPSCFMCFNFLKRDGSSYVDNTILDLSQFSRDVHEIIMRYLERGDVLERSQMEAWKKQLPDLQDIEIRIANEYHHAVEDWWHRDDPNCNFICLHPGSESGFQANKFQRLFQNDLERIAQEKKQQRQQRIANRSSDEFNFCTVTLDMGKTRPKFSEEGAVQDDSKQSSS
eukprot:gene173-977_t